MEPPDALAVQVACLRKLYGKVVAVDDVSFEVEGGSVFCIIGPNGAGKTTAIECLEGLRQPDSGSVLVAGLDPIADRGRLVHRIGAQLQEVGIPPRMKAREALSLFAALYRTSIPLSELSDELGLAGSRSKPYGSLSGGQKRRVNIALALVGDPEIVFLDEPTTGLDPESRFRFWDYLRRQNSPWHDDSGDDALPGGSPRVLRRGPADERGQGGDVWAARAPYRRVGTGGARRHTAGGAWDRRRGRLGGTAGRRPRPENGDWLLRLWSWQGGERSFGLPERQGSVARRTRGAARQSG